MTIKYKHLLFLLLLPMTGNGQLLWPGDVNNNGIVNHIDALYLGNVFGFSGPSRAISQQGIDWNAKSISATWPGDFANGVNHVYADCDGDGFVSFFDHQAIFDNYGETHGVITPDDFSQGIEGIDPSLRFDAPIGGPTIEGFPLLIPLILGEENNIVEDFYGIAFTIQIDPTIFSNTFHDFSLIESWIDDSPIPPLMFSHYDEITGELNVLISKTDGMAVSGHGPIGMLFIVIEDIAVGMSEPQIETTIQLKNVKLVDDLMTEQTIYADSTVITILNDDVIDNTNNAQKSPFKLYPQPATNFIIIESKNQNLQELALYDLSGKINQYYEPSNDPIQKLDISDLASGFYLFKIRTDQGWFAHKIIVQ